MRRLIERPCNTSFPSCLYPNRTPIDIAYMACYSDLGHHSANSPSSQLNFASISRPKALPATFASDYHVIALIAMHTLISEKSPYAPASKYSLSERAMLYLLPKSISKSIDHPSRTTCANVSEQNAHYSGQSDSRHPRQCALVLGACSASHSEICHACLSSHPRVLQKVVFPRNSQLCEMQGSTALI